MKHPRSFTLAMCIVLAACNQQDEKKPTGAGVGEVLPGSISDAMIDLDTSTATPPLAPAEVKTGSKESSGSNSAAADEAPTDETALDSPAAAPAAAVPDRTD